MEEKIAIEAHDEKRIKTCSEDGIETYVPSNQELEYHKTIFKLITSNLNKKPEETGKSGKDVKEEDDLKENERKLSETDKEWEWKSVVDQLFTSKIECDLLIRFLSLLISSSSSSSSSQVAPPPPSSSCSLSIFGNTKAPQSHSKTLNDTMLSVESKISSLHNISLSLKSQCTLLRESLHHLHSASDDVTEKAISSSPSPSPTSPRSSSSPSRLMSLSVSVDGIPQQPFSHSFPFNSSTFSSFTSLSISCPSRLLPNVSLLPDNVSFAISNHSFAISLERLSDSSKPQNDLSSPSPSLSNYSFVEILFIQSVLSTFTRKMNAVGKLGASGELRDSLFRRSRSKDGTSGCQDCPMGLLEFVLRHIETVRETREVLSSVVKGIPTASVEWPPPPSLRAGQFPSSPFCLSFQGKVFLKGSIDGGQIMFAQENFASFSSPSRGSWSSPIETPLDLGEVAASRLRSLFLDSVAKRCQNFGLTVHRNSKFGSSHFLDVNWKGTTGKAHSTLIDRLSQSKEISAKANSCLEGVRVVVQSQRESPRLSIVIQPTSDSEEVSKLQDLLKTLLGFGLLHPISKITLPQIQEIDELNKEGENKETDQQEFETRPEGGPPDTDLTNSSTEKKRAKSSRRGRGRGAKRKRR